MLARVFAALAAILLVGAIALGTLTPVGLTLGKGLALMDDKLPAWLRDQSPTWLWNWVEVPLLVRPLWLIPVSLGLICVGMATTLNLGDAPPRRRRS